MRNSCLCDFQTFSSLHLQKILGRGKYFLLKTTNNGTSNRAFCSLLQTENNDTLNNHIHMNTLDQPQLCLIIHVQGQRQLDEVLEEQSTK